MSQHILSYIENKAIRDNLPYRYNGETATGHYILFGLPVTKENIEELGSGSVWFLKFFFLLERKNVLFFLLISLMMMNANCSAPKKTTPKELFNYQPIPGRGELTKKQFDDFIKRQQDSCKCVFTY